MDIINDLDDLDEINIVNRVPRRIYERADYFNSFDNVKFFQRFRISKQTALHILDLIDVQIERPYDL